MEDHQVREQHGNQFGTIGERGNLEQVTNLEALLEEAVRENEKMRQQFNNLEQHFTDRIVRERQDGINEGRLAAIDDHIPQRQQNVMQGHNTRFPW